jgi:release factor glutamine methyltransferase
MGELTLDILLREARKRLAEAGVAESALDARILVEHLTGTTRVDAIRNPEMTFEDGTEGRIRLAIDRRIAGESAHRIVGWREFYGMKLRLSAGTLEPRPDTETVVDLVVPFLRAGVALRGRAHILDLGTGTGAIALALLTQIPELNAVATDISADALATAMTNAKLNRVSDRMDVVESDWFADVNGRFDVIVSNPPYIKTQTIETLLPEVRLFDPLPALDGGLDGLDAYRTIANEADAYLADDGRVAVEIGWDQKDQVVALFENAGFRLEKGAIDLAGNDRALIFRG